MLRFWFAFAALIWSLAVTGFLAFGPVYSWSTTVSESATGQERVTEMTGHKSDLEVNGLVFLRAAAIPLILCIASVLGYRWRGVAFASAALLLGFCVVGAASMGLFYLPAVVMLILAGTRSMGDAEAHHHPR
ncbi:MAG TPA: hypothetical protein VN428_20255 [Bryobacteraceae bacterium]|nr:hypothetical protein [Bryobacteraceae bacterium]